MVSALWILFDVAISLRLVFVPERMATWEIAGWATFGLALGVGAWVSEHRAERRHERAMGELRDKLTEQAGFNRGSVAALGEHTAAMVAGVTRLLELAGGQGAQDEVRKQVAAVANELDRVALNQLTIIETPPSWNPRQRYSLKVYVHVLNETGREITVRSPSRWNGARLYRPDGEAEIRTLLQLWDQGEWVPKGPDGPPTLTVPPGRIFRFWLGFDPSLADPGLQRIDKLRDKTQLGTFTLPVVIAGREYEWSKAV
jgi:hypothetical protein